MSNQIKELALPVILVVLLIGFPVYVAAETPPTSGLNINPISAALSAGEWIVDKINNKPQPKFHTAERQARFDSWSKEEWIKDDPYACMWDRNWIRKYKQDVCL